MIKTIYEKINKASICSMPKETFPGRIFTITSETETDKAVEYLMGETVLGIDTETRPSFRKHVENKVALLQVSTHDTCFLFRLNRTGMTESLVRLLEDASITKVGLSLKDDLRTLSRRHKFTPRQFIELQDEVKEIGIVDASLQKIYANLFGKMISKRQRLSNWEADIMTDAQKSYAAIDAWACVMIHDEIKRLKATHDYKLVKAEETVAEVGIKTVTETESKYNNTEQTTTDEQDIS